MRTIYYLTTAALLAMPSISHAQAANEQDVSEQAVSTGDIVVTAQRRSEKARDVPISMTVLNSEALTSQGVTDTVSLERVTPGLTMQRQNGYVNPSLRGITTSVITAGAENPIAIYLDGVYVGNQGASVFSLADVDRVEVLKGPQGTLFGRNATGGAIQIFTQKPSMTPKARVEATAGMFTGAGTSRSAYDLSIRGFVSAPLVADTVAASLSFSTTRSNGYNTNVVFGAVSNDVDRTLGSSRTGKANDYSLRGKLLIEPTSNFSILLSGHYSHAFSERGQGGYIAYNGTGLSDAELSFPGRITPTKPWQDGFDALENNFAIDSRGGSARAELETSIGTFTSTTAFSWAKYAENQDSDKSYIPGCLAAFACTGVYDAITNRDFQQELVFASEKFGNFSFVAGVNYYNSKARVDVNVNDFVNGSKPLGNVTLPQLFFYHQQVRTKSYGIFIEGNYQVTDKLTLIAGVRYSDEKKLGTLLDLGTIDFAPFLADGVTPNPNFFTTQTLVTNLGLNNTFAKKWTPRLSLRYALDGRTNVYATFSQGFKTGLIPGGAIGAPRVNPEQLTAYEIGLKTSQQSFTLNVAAFLYEYKDIQVQSNGGIGGAVNFVANAAKGRIYGLDVDGSWDVTPNFTISGGVSWLPYAKYLDYQNAPVFLPRCIDSNNPTRLNVTSGAGVFCPGDSLNLSGTRLFKTPKVTATFNASYRADLGSGELSITPNVYYASNLFTDPTHLSALSTDNFKLGAEIAYKPKESNWRVSLWGKNLTNNSSFQSLSNNPSGLTIIPSDPQEIGLTFRFDM